MPALMKNKDKICFSGISYASPEEWFGSLADVSNELVLEQQKGELTKARSFTSIYGGNIYCSYQKLIESPEVDAVYIPLPPALHYKWAKFALENGKHVLVEKPSTTCFSDTLSLVNMAMKNKKTIHENYMFLFHKQIFELKRIIDLGEIGDVRLYRISFGFPLRPLTDFRYNKQLGGGALLDAGGYCLKYADFLLGKNSLITAASMNHIPNFEVDMYGSATMVNEDGQVAQIAFGMDNDYRCDVEIWGSKGTITSNRILTAPVDYTPCYTIKRNRDVETRVLSEDDSFQKSISHFVNCIEHDDARIANYSAILRQAQLVDDFLNLS